MSTCMYKYVNNVPDNGILQVSEGRTAQNVTLLNAAYAIGVRCIRLRLAVQL